MSWLCIEKKGIDPSVKIKEREIWRNKAIIRRSPKIINLLPTLLTSQISSGNLHLLIDF
jgi:hypothetical protein